MFLSILAVGYGNPEHLGEVIGKVKDFFGIEGVQLALSVDPKVKLSSGSLAGVLTLSSLRAQKVTMIHITLEERYQRGRGEDKLIDTYILGELITGEELVINANEQVELPFVLGFAERPTALDKLTGTSILLRPLNFLARKTIGASSIFTLRASAKVVGVKLQPECKLVLDL